MANNPTSVSDSSKTMLRAPGATLEREGSMLVRLRRYALWGIPVSLLVSYLLTWAILLAPNPNKLIVQSDFVSTLTGAKMISAGNGQQLYDLSAQLAAQKAIRTPYMGDEGTALLPYM